MENKYFCIVGLGNHSRSKIIPAVEKINGKIEGIVTSKTNVENNYELFPSLSDALSKVKPETIFILCTPPDLHYSQALKIIENGHNLFIEKPVTIKLIELKKIIYASNKKKTFFVENFMHQYSKFYYNFINLWEKQKKEIKKIDVEFTLPSMPKNTFRHKSKNYPINLYDIGSYVVSLVNNLSEDATLFIYKISNKGHVDSEKIILKGKVFKADVLIIIGLNCDYSNFVKITKFNKAQFKFEPFFFGREGERILQENDGTNINNISFYCQDCFQTLFGKKESHWFNTQSIRNKAMISNLSLLENLSKQYNSILKN